MRCRFLGAEGAWSPGLALVMHAILAAGCGAGRSELNVIADAGADAAPPPPDAAPPPVETSDKVDLLLVVDNAEDTEPIHQLFTNTVPYLLDRLAHPACVNGLGNVVATTPNPTDACPVGTRDFPAVNDLHIAVVTTSLGGHGADVCNAASADFDPAQNDAARLITRGAAGGVVATYENQGFLAWDPSQKATPPGELDFTRLTSSLEQLNEGAGEHGCMFGAPLESMYRFLVDPSPYTTISIANGKAIPAGVDNLLLTQRAEFLRPDSALVVVMMTGRDDCSTREGGQFYLSNQRSDPNNPATAFHLPRARAVCATSPNDPCCASCGQTAPAGCPALDVNCTPTATLTAAEDPIALRCFDQKRRFGIDFLYPIERYVDGLTQPFVATSDGSMAVNPIYAQGRSPKLVMMAGIVGVPWQDVAKDPKALAIGYAPAAEIDWSLILGDADAGTPPGDPLMIASISPRSGQNPPTGTALAPPDAGPLANPINGHERNIARLDDLQNACIYPRPSPRNCDAGACDCVAPDLATNPICQAADGTYSSTSGFARALPATRELAVLRGLGDRATVASVCAAIATGTDAPTFGYKPAVDAIVRTLRPRLR